MYWFDHQQHRTPHLHARYAGDEAMFDLAGNCWKEISAPE